LPKLWKLISSLVVFGLLLVLISFGFKWYAYAHTPMYTVKTFVKAVLNGDEKTIDHLNYTDRHEQTIKKAWIDKLNGYNFNDFEFTVADPSYGDKIFIKTIKDKDITIQIDVELMNDSYYVTRVLP